LVQQGQREPLALRLWLALAQRERQQRQEPQALQQPGQTPLEPEPLE
jgi:hypothetical protein